MELTGTNIALRPMTLRERQVFFRWATQSDATPWWYGPLYGDDIPSYIVFKAEWPDYYFDGSRPSRGRCFAIMYQGKAIGQINYNQIESDGTTELDVLIASSKHQGRGLGTDAICTLTRYLFEEKKLRRCRVEVVGGNPRAARAYEKAGFVLTYAYVREGILWHVMELLRDDSVVAEPLEQVVLS